MRQDFSERVLQTKKLMKFYTPYNYPLIHLRYLNLRLFKVYEIHGCKNINKKSEFMTKTHFLSKADILNLVIERKIKKKYNA